MLLYNVAILTSVSSAQLYCEVVREFFVLCVPFANITTPAETVLQFHHRMGPSTNIVVASGYKWQKHNNDDDRHEGIKIVQDVSINWNWFVQAFLTGSRSESRYTLHTHTHQFNGINEFEQQHKWNGMEVVR